MKPEYLIRNGQPRAVFKNWKTIRKWTPFIRLATNSARATLAGARLFRFAKLKARTLGEVWKLTVFFTDEKEFGITLTITVVSVGPTGLHKFIANTCSINI